jgi:DNA modification methylase
MNQLTFFNDTLPKQKLPTNLTTRNHAVHRWFNFIAGFSPEFVSQCIEESRVNATDGVLIDPFAGMSTALVQANMDGVQSVGYEPHPFFYDISKAKIHLTDTECVSEIQQVCESLGLFQNDLSSVWSTDALKFLMKLVPESELRILASALQVEPLLPVQNRPMFRLVVSRLLEHTAQSQTDGIYKAPTSAKRSRGFAESVSPVCNEIREDLNAVSNFCRDRATLYAKSSELMTELGDGSCSICVTSPPYLNNFDFAEMTRMELYFWKYAGSWGEITERVRRKLIVNTTTAPADLKRRQDDFRNTLSSDLVAELVPVVTELRSRKKERAGKKDYDLLVYPYFAQMQRVIAELARVLLPDAPLHLLVADAALYGVHIHTERFLAMIMRQKGFDVVAVERLRSRGERWILEKREGSSTPLGEFHIYARRK